jgi:YVTN family beta-propeller protein
VAFSPDGSKVDVATDNENTVSVIDTATNAVTTIGVLGPIGVAVSPNGSKVYVTSGAVSVSVVDTATNTVTTTIKDPSFVHRIAFASSSSLRQGSPGGPESQTAMAKVSLRWPGGTAGSAQRPPR